MKLKLKLDNLTPEEFWQIVKYHSILSYAALVQGKRWEYRKVRAW